MSLFVAIVAIFAVIAAITYFSASKTPTIEDITNENENEENVVENDEAIIKQDEDTIEDIIMEEKEDETTTEKENDAITEQKEEEIAQGKITMYTGITLAGKSSPLLDFNKADYDVALKSDKLVVLYFYANWCPICRVEFPKMQEAFNELTTDQVIGFRVNYNDSETDDDEKSLAKQFGVAYQHTKVLVKNRERILKSPEGWDKNRYTNEISKALGQ